ncbi:MAG: dihydropteroate synthase [Anaerolineae bacterium]|jgi:5-methyltetrahydrofolate corrinoid/iron sulfur protein methyltransferase|nr:dihydropteroate synthase [Anaerolineae bacterium]
MRIIGENIHILSPKVKEAIANRDRKFFQESAVRQVEAGAWALDLNVGPQKKLGHEILPWLVDAVQEVVDVPLSLDTTNLTAIEAACEIVKHQPFINSTSAEPERLERVPLVAAKYNSRLIALTMRSEGIPVSADARVNIALEELLPRAEEVGMPITDMYIDPLVLTVSGCQQYVPECIEAVRILQVAGDPPPGVVVGLSNVSNAVPNEMRPLINRVYCVMLMGAGLNTCIADPLDGDLREFIRVVEERDESTSFNRLLLNLHDAVAAADELQADQVDFSDPQQVDVWKTVQILLNKVIYADSYLRV